MNSMARDVFKKTWVKYALATFGIASVTAVLLPLRGHINSTTVGFAYLLIVVFVAILWGSKPALLASLLGMLSFNFFFLPPYHTFRIADPQNWVALASFFITALAVGQLSARARRRAEEAEAGTSPCSATAPMAPASIRLRTALGCFNGTSFGGLAASARGQEVHDFASPGHPGFAFVVRPWFRAF